MAPSSGSIDSRGLHDLGRGSRTRFGQLRLPIHAICDHQGNEFSDHATIMLLDWRRSRLRAPSSQAIARCGRGATAVLTGSKLTARIVDHDCLPSAAREANGPRSRSRTLGGRGLVKLDGTPSRYPPNPGRTMRAPNKEQARACSSVPIRPIISSTCRCCQRWRLGSWIRVPLRRRWLRPAEGAPYPGRGHRYRRSALPSQPYDMTVARPGQLVVPRCPFRWPLRY